jgi:hypothetical protein
VCSESDYTGRERRAREYSAVALEGLVVVVVVVVVMRGGGGGDWELPC